MVFSPALKILFSSSFGLSILANSYNLGLLGFPSSVKVAEEPLRSRNFAIDVLVSLCCQMWYLIYALFCHYCLYFIEHTHLI